MPPEDYYKKRREAQDKIINEYLEHMKKKEEKNQFAAETVKALGIEFTLNLN